MAEIKYPTYGELLFFLEEAETECDVNTSVAELLAANFRMNYPSIPISRPNRFLDTVRRICAPTRPSAKGQQKLDGSPLCFYLRRQWIPRMRHTQGTCKLNPILKVQLSSCFNTMMQVVLSFPRN